MEDENKDNEKQEKEEKKEGKFSAFVKKVSKKLDDAAYDSRLNSDFAKKNVSYRVYTGCSVFSANPEIAAEEHLDEGYVIALGTDDNIKAGCLICKVNDKKVYHIAAVENTTLTVEFEGKTNEKEAQKITLGDEAEKVDVIKVEDDFYRV